MKFDINTLFTIIQKRLKTESESSYTYRLSKKGIEGIAQKVGEETTELIIETIRKERNKNRIIEEAADLMYHYCVLLASSGINIEEVYDELNTRSIKKISNK